MRGRPSPASLSALGFAFLLGCGGGAASSPTPASTPASDPVVEDPASVSVDSMACAVDADCVLGTPRDCCGAHCPVDVQAWSSSAWAAYQDECAVEECPISVSYSCLAQPDWVQPVAVCQAGQCALARPTASDTAG